MGCNQALTGIPRDCGTSMGGIKRILLANFDDVLRPVVDEVTKKIKAINFASTSSPKFKEFILRKGVGELTHSLQVNTENGVNYIENTVALAFGKMDTEKRVAVSVIAVNEMVGIVEDMNGKFWFLGYDEPLTATGGDGGTGQGKTDANRYGINLGTDSETYPYEILVGEGGVNLDEIID